MVGPSTIRTTLRLASRLDSIIAFPYTFMVVAIWACRISFCWYYLTGRLLDRWTNNGPANPSPLRPSNSWGNAITLIDP
jgi:hypothetical protein